MSAAMQQINLYLPELQPRRDLVTMARLTRVVLGLFLLAAILTGVQTFRKTSLEARLMSVQDALAVQTARTEQLERDVAARATDQELVREMNARELRVAQSAELYDFMQGTTLGNLIGYSEHLKDLSRASFTGIWLTEIQISGNAESVMIRGSAQQPAMLPDFVGRLSTGRSAISSRRFNRLVSSRAQTTEEVYDFVLEAGR